MNGVLIFLSDKKDDAMSCSPVVIPLPSKRGRKKKSTLPLVGSPTGSDALMLGHLAGQVCLFLKVRSKTSSSSESSIKRDIKYGIKRDTTGCGVSNCFIPLIQR